MGKSLPKPAISIHIVPMRVDRIKDLIQTEFQGAALLELEDLSHQHAGRAGTESHFKLKLVSEKFEGMSRVQRQRQINQLMATEFEAGLHALTMRLLTPQEEEKLNSNFTAPNCQGGEK